MTDVKLNLYGAFRQLGVSEITLNIPEKSTVGNLREILKLHVSQLNTGVSERIIDISAFATEDRILRDCDIASGHRSLSILPPVCGG